MLDVYLSVHNRCHEIRANFDGKNNVVICAIKT